MIGKKLSRKFFARDTRTVARELPGKILARKIGDKIIRAVITETEAYCGPNDLANHASRGRTKRTEIMFGKPGLVYVYLIYGMYHCLNIVTGREGYPAAVLIRGCALMPRPIPGVKEVLTPGAGDLNGPGKLCRHLQIDRSLNAKDLITNGKLRVEDAGIIMRKSQIKTASRIGVDYAGKYKYKKWRYFVKLP